MSLPLLFVVTVAALAAGYQLYGRFLARQLRLDDAAQTPAVRHDDGVDFSPTPKGYLLGQHFSAIAAAGPIVGPILACQQFGWLPCVLWIVLGCILIGAVHDLGALVASVRHDARTVAELVRQHLSARAWVAFMSFIWLALLYVIVAFVDVTAGTFVGVLEELPGVDVGGAVAFSSAAYLGLAMVMGLLQRRFAPPLWLLTLVFVPATLGVVALGSTPGCAALLTFADPAEARRWWGVAILAYCFVASLLPMWLLMQPRGYLGGFVLYIVLAVGVVGVLFGDFVIAQPAFKGFTQIHPPDHPQAGQATATGLLFPFLFVTIACGACSGFHGLVCSGTTSKQIAKEGDCRPVGYGGMLLEAVVAIIALSTVMIVAAPKGAAGALYGRGIGEYLCVLIGREHLAAATIFGTMAFSTFVFDTLDVATRLGRYCLQELTGRRSAAAGAAATAATIALPLLIVLTTKPGGGAYLAYWTLFGASNQLLAGLTLLAVTVWLLRTGRAWWYAAAPMVAVLAITVTALLRIAATGLGKRSGDALDVPANVNGVVSLALLALSALLVVEGARAARRKAAAPGDGPVAGWPGPPPGAAPAGA